MRGTVARAWARTARRIIPARAGNSRPSSRPKRRSRDHPRACGEQVLRQDDRGGGSGSSPRVRGTARADVPDAAARGIIPARAGNRSKRGSGTVSARDHPRACGEQVLRQDDRGGGSGSSPRVRGTARRRGHAHALPGIIPARAGNSHDQGTCAACGGDHPRACGEQGRSAARGRTPWGSSPRVRGTAPVGTLVRARLGIIPARAGNSPSRRVRGGAARDHPRACGEQPGCTPSFAQLLGSSPRVRGTARRPQVDRAHDGIIPARAGNSPPRSWRTGSPRDHPRACGEQCLTLSFTATLMGSSPRVRGTARGRTSARIRAGIIPARAGNSPPRPTTCG